MSARTGGNRPTILVMGATGAQGGGVARHLLERGRFAVRALTRKPEGERARALAAAGAEVVRGDLDDRTSLERALKDCYGVFGVTNFWEHYERELEHGHNLIDAVAASDVEHFVFSTLPHIEKATGGELRSPHFDLKAELEDRARALELPATFVHVAFYFDNFIHFFPPRPEEDGRYVFGFPQGNTRLAGVAAGDVGGVVAEIFQRPTQFMGRALYVVGDDLTPDEYAAAMTRAVGAPVAYRHIPREIFAELGFPGADDLADMFEFYRTRVPNRQADLVNSRALYPRMQSFSAWAERNREALAEAIGLVGTRV